MVVRTLGSGRDVSGLYIGPENARRHFPRDQQHVELHLGHLHIHCELLPEFWDGSPQISDNRLGAWLFSRFFHGKGSRAPAPVELIPAGKSAFRVVPFSLPAVSANGLTKIGPPPAALHKGKDKASGDSHPSRPGANISLGPRPQS